MGVRKVGTAWLNPNRLRPTGRLYYDIGACTGKLSHLLISRYGGKCIAYEPGIVGDSITPRKALTIRRQAVWRRNGQIEFNDCPAQAQSSSIMERSFSRGAPVRRTVPAVTLGIAFRGVEWIDLVSIDIEGAEWELLLDGSNGIENLRRADQVCIELHTEFAGGHTIEEMITALRDRAWLDCRIVEGEGTRRPILWGAKVNMSPRPACNQWLRQALAGRHYQHVLNLGCGEDRDQEGGLYSRDYFGADKVTRCDIAATGAADVVAAAEDLSAFADGTFDLVFANWMIYKTDIPRSLREIARVLRPGGHVMLSYGHQDIELIRTITAAAQSILLPIANCQLPIEQQSPESPSASQWAMGNSQWAMDYAAGNLVRRAEAVFGALRPDAAEAFIARFQGPVLALVAHWDDEVLSLGGTIGTYGAAPTGSPGSAWTVVSATHRDQEPTYRRVFETIGADLGFTPVTLDIRQRERPWDKPAEGRHDYTRTVKRVPLTAALLREQLQARLGDLSRFKTVITHCHTGDYGQHPQHKELAQAAAEIFGDSATCWSFNLKCGTAEAQLPDDVIDRKLALIRRYKPGFKRHNVAAREFLLPLR